MRKYRSFAEVYPDEQFDVDKAWDEWRQTVNWNENPAGFEEAFKTGWEAAEKKLMALQNNHEES